MDKIAVTKKQTIILNILFLTFPLSFILGHAFINLNLVLISLLTLIFFKKEVFKMNFLLVDKLFFLLFLYSIFVAIFNSIEMYQDDKISNDNTILIKSTLYLRYLLFYLILRFLVEKNILNFKWFFYICGLLCLYVCAEIFYQFIFGQTFFGDKLSPIQRKMPGPFGKEWIAGGYLLRFSLFALFGFALFAKFKNHLLHKSLLILLVIIIFLGIFLSGNRIPFAFFVIGLALIMLFEKKVRKYLSVFAILFSVIFFVGYKSSFEVRINFKELYSSIAEVSYKMYALTAGHEMNYWRYGLPPVFHEWESFYDTWQMNKYIGGGIRSFRLNCPKRATIDNIDIDERITCNTHPHNYYLEIMTDLGIVGLIIIFFIFFAVFVKPFYRKYITQKIEDNIFIGPFLFAFFLEVFPIKSTGSFFTTNVSTIIVLYMAIIVSLGNKKV